jgi:AraC-like DNA-binding protein
MSFTRAESFPLHTHRASHAMFVYGGEWTDRVGTTKRRLGRGDVLFQPAGIEHATSAAPGTSVVILDFSATILAGFCGLYGFYPRTILTSFDDVEQIPERIHAELSHIDEATPAVIYSLVLQLLAVGSRAPIEANPKVPEWMPRLIAYIQANLGERLTVVKLAARAAVSASQLSHSFVKYFNRSVGDYIRDCRIRAAERALRYTADPIQKIAWDTGFSDQAHFCRVFKAARGVTPTEYRLTRARPVPAADPVLARRREPILACCVRDA